MRPKLRQLSDIQYLEIKYGSLSDVPPDHPKLIALQDTYSKKESRLVYPERLSMRTPKYLWQSLKEVSDDLEMTRAELLRLLVKNYLGRPFELDHISVGHYKQQSKSTIYVSTEMKEAVSEEILNLGIREYDLLNSLMDQGIRDYHRNDLEF